MAFLVATTSLPAVYCPNDDRWNAARPCQFREVVLQLIDREHPLSDAWFYPISKKVVNFDVIKYA